MHESSDTYPFSLQQDLIWRDMDAFQHVNNAVFFRYFEDVRMFAFEQLGVNAYMSEHQVGPILAHTEANFKAPLLFPDRITISTCISDIHKKKFTMHYRVYSEKLNQIVCEGTGLIVYFDYQAQRSAAIPEVIRKNILQHV